MRRGGPGLWVAERTGASIVGIDFSAAAVAAATALAERRNMSQRARFVIADATATGLAGESVSSIVSIDVLMFVDAQQVAKEIARVLKPGGAFVATAAESLVEPFIPTLVRDYRPIFERVGFSVRVHEKPTASDERQLAFYRALLERGDALRAEIGETAEVLLEEARNGMERSRRQTSRVRNVLFVAERAWQKVVS